MANGNENTVSDNFKNGQIEIFQSELSEEQKQQITEFLEEIKNTKVAGGDTKEKIRKVVRDFLVGTMSNVVAVPVIEIISSFCNNI